MQPESARLGGKGHLEQRLHTLGPETFPDSVCTHLPTRVRRLEDTAHDLVEAEQPDEPPVAIKRAKT